MAHWRYTCESFENHWPRQPSWTLPLVFFVFGSWQPQVNITQRLYALMSEWLLFFSRRCLIAVSYLVNCLCLQPVLECAVQKGLVYNKVNPIFHHWRVEDRKFGLTFQSPADAISFEKGLQTVIDKLDRGTQPENAFHWFSTSTSGGTQNPSSVTQNSFWYKLLTSYIRRLLTVIGWPVTVQKKVVQKMSGSSYVKFWLQL